MIVKCIFHSMRHIHQSNEEQTGKPMFAPAEIEPLCSMLSKILTLVGTVKVETYKAFQLRKQFDFDEEDMVEFKQEMQKNTKVASFVMEFSGQLVQNYKD